MGSASARFLRAALLTGAAALAAGASAGAAAAAAGVSASVTSNAVRMSAVCPGAHGATFAVTGPDGKSFTVSTPNNNTSGFATAGHPRGTYRFTATCADGSSAGAGTFVIAPIGGPMGGDGGKADPTGALTAGILLLGAAAAGGILLRRRATVPR